MTDSAVYGAEKFLRDNGDKIPEANRTAVQSEIDAVKGAMGGGDPATMTAAAQRLEQVLQQAGAAMYQQSASQPAPDAGPTDGGRSDEDVVEGEFSDAN